MKLWNINQYKDDFTMKLLNVNGRSMSYQWDYILFKFWVIYGKDIKPENVEIAEMIIDFESLSNDTTFDM